MTRHKGCTIVRTEAVCLNDGRRLYQITGRLAKEAGRRPFLTTLLDAREWIDQQDLPAAYAASSRSGLRDLMDE